MKLTEMQLNQNMIVQLVWGEEQIEFFADVVAKDEMAVYVTPYIYNCKELELNVVEGKGVICNIFMDDPNTKQRISWRNIELTTVHRNDRIVYCLRTHEFNSISNVDDRRYDDRIIVELEATVLDDSDGDGIKVIVHDISDVGISFYAKNSFNPETPHLKIAFTDIVHGKEYDVQVECAISRISHEDGHVRVGCRTTKENKEYNLYRFMKYLCSRCGKDLEAQETEAVD